MFRKTSLIAAASLALTLAFVQPSLAAGAYEPPRGSAERAAINDAVRPMMEARLGAPVEFVVERMQVANGWAFVILLPQRPGGKAIDLSQTMLADLAEISGDASLYALLREANGRWNIIDFAIGPTDAFWYGQPLYEQLPAGLVPQ
ncbi:hypothetical protein [Pannonibacter sp.]|uniref:hypothetical protein n=1 Tax=Pannonibacter sp. TaxID=1906786 RepID=UPI003F71AE6E